MKTEDLIRALTADHAARGSTLEWDLSRAAVFGFAIATGLYAVILGPRPNIIAAIGDPRFAFKLILAILLAATSAMLVLRLVRPAARAKAWFVIAAAVPVLLFAAVLIELIVVPRALWPTRLIGSNAILCLASIPTLAASILIAALSILRRGAPTRPGMAGAVAGLFAGALAAALYGTHCPDDSPLFVAVWYSLAIAVVAIIGGLAGKKLLRW